MIENRPHIKICNFHCEKGGTCYLFPNLQQGVFACRSTFTFKYNSFYNLGYKSTIQQKEMPKKYEVIVCI